MAYRLLALLALLPLAACATTSGPGAGTVTGADLDGVAKISFSAEPCYGFCPAFDVTVTADGTGQYVGRSYVKETGRHIFVVSPEQFAHFRDRLAPFRPAASATYGYDNCDGPLATDNPSVKVTWQDTDGRETTLDWYMGCRQPGLSENREAIYRAYRELPIDALVGPDGERQNYQR